ncbi:MAG: hypothetical protein RI967_1351 [Planctomycetota bacterium]
MRKEADAPDVAALDAIDADWLRRRSAVMPFGLGLVGLLGSVLLLGLLFGPLGLRASVDLWRTGSRRAMVVAGGVLSALAIVASVTWAMLWGSVLASVLLGRDAMRVAERWRGLEIAAETLRVSDRAGDEVELAFGADGATVLVVFVDPSSTLTADALARAVGVADGTGARIVAATPLAARAELAAALGAVGERALLADREVRWPSPLDGVAAFPTTVVIDGAGRIAGALIGVHPEDDLRRLVEHARAHETVDPAEGSSRNGPPASAARDGVVGNAP